MLTRPDKFSLFLPLLFFPNFVPEVLDVFLALAEGTVRFDWFITGLVSIHIFDFRDAVRAFNPKSVGKSL